MEDLNSRAYQQKPLPQIYYCLQLTKIFVQSRIQQQKSFNKAYCSLQHTQIKNNLIFSIILGQHFEMIDELKRLIMLMWQSIIHALIFNTIIG